MAAVIFRQGALIVSRIDAGYRIVDGALVAELDDAGAITSTRLPDTDAARLRFDAVVVVVAEALRRRVLGSFHLHAGAVAVGDGVVLIAGDGGQGKTTTTLALEARGAVRCGDDVVFVRRAGAKVVAAAWPRPLHVGRETRQMFPEIERHVVAGQSLAGKAIVDVAGDDREREVVGLILPRIDRTPASKTHAAIASAVDVMARLLTASAMVHWAGVPRAQEHLDVLGLLTGVPACVLTLGADALSAPATIGDVVVTALPRVGWT